MRKYFAGLTKDTYILTFVSLFSDISTEMLYPILPIFLTQVLGASVGIVGLIEGIANGTQFLVQGFTGWLSDKVKNRKWVAAAGYALAAASKPLIGLSSYWEQVLVARFADRLGAGGRSAPRDALIVASVGPHDSGKAFGLEGFGDNLGAFIGPLITVLLLFYLNIGIRPIFYIALVPGVASFILILMVKDRTKTIAVEEPIKSSMPSLHQLPAGYWRYLISIGVFGLGNSTNAFLILRANSLGLPLISTLVTYSVFNLVASISSYPSGYLSDKFGHKQVLLVALLVYVVSYLGFFLSTNLVLLATLFALYGLFQGTFRAVGKAVASDLIPEHIKATGIGFYSAVIGVTGLIASLVGGQLWDRVEPQATFLYGAALGILAMGLIYSSIGKKVQMISKFDR
jgi:MFS family permease